MLKIFKKILGFIIFTIIIYIFISNPSIIIDSVNTSINLFIKNIFVSLFPFFILSDILINYNYIYYLSKILKFKYSYIILMSMLSGLPSNAKYIKELLDKNLINEKDASILMSFTFFPNPMFVVASIGLMIFNNSKIGILLLISIYLSNILIYIINYKNLSKIDINYNNNTLSFPNLLKTSIINNINTLLVILGTIVLFTTITNIIFNYIQVSPIQESIITSILEMTIGIKKISDLSISTNLKYILISNTLSLSGISILMQASSILSDYKINYKTIIKNKIIILSIINCINYFYIIFFM